MDRRYLPIAVALVVCTVIASAAWSTVRLSRPTTIDVRGSAKKRIVSDLVEWSASVSASRGTRVEAYAALKKDVETALRFVAEAGVPNESVRTSAVELNELSHEETIEEHGRYRSKTVFDGWRAEQRVEVSSSDVARLEKLSREATQLLEQGLVITSSAPRYLYTKLGELKIEMLAEASRDARTRAERMLGAAGGGATVGRVEGIDTGVVNINAANSTETSWEGNYDTSSFEKDILTTVRVRFEVKN